MDLIFGGRLIRRIISFGPEKKYRLQSQKFIKIHQFNHLHRQKHLITDSNPRQRTGHFLVLIAGKVQCCLPRRRPKNGLGLLGVSCTRLRILLNTICRKPGFNSLRTPLNHGAEQASNETLKQTQQRN